jgi:hypothetical protein
MRARMGGEGRWPLDQPCQVRQETRHRELRECAASNAQNTRSQFSRNETEQPSNPATANFGCCIVCDIRSPPALQTHA